MTTTVTDPTVAAELVQQTLLFLTDRSRIVSGWGRCRRRRWIEFHSGPTGYGIRPKKNAIPLMTGLGVHKVLELIFKWVLANPLPNGTQQLPDRDYIRECIITATHAYISRVTGRGFLDAPTTDTERIVREQCALLEGLTWGACRTILPQLLLEYKVVLVEEEHVLVLACTCGLGDFVGRQHQHDSRGCQGIGLMTRGDLILQRYVDLAYTYLDFKTSGDVNKWNWPEEFGVSLQGPLTIVAAEAYHDIKLDGGFMVLGLHKGWRKSEQEEDEFGNKVVTESSAKHKVQDSPFVYAWRRPSNPPNWEEEWKFSYKYKEINPKTGELVGRTLQGKGFEKAPLWEAEFPMRPAGWSPVEYATEAMPEGIVRKQFKLAGPFVTSALERTSILNGLVNEENAWRERLWKIYEAATAALEAAPTANPLTNPTFIKVLDEQAPQTRECWRWNKVCEFYDMCKMGQVWADPLGSGQFELRRPHHDPEILQALAGGIELPPEQDDEDEGD